MSSEDPKYSVREYAALDLPFEAELTAFRESGARGVGLSWFAPPKSKRPATERIEVDLKESGLQPTLCWPSVISVLPLSADSGPRDPAARIAAMVSEIEKLSALSPLGIGCVTGPIGELSPEEARRIAARGLREAADAARRYGMKLAIEPIHPSIAGDLSLITTLPDTVSLIDEVGTDNVGIVFDIWHLYGHDRLLADIDRYVDRFLLVDVCDWREPPRSWCDRLLPGDGRAGVPAILRALRKAGYDGWFELEIMSDDGTYGNDFEDSLWKWDADQLLRTGYESFMRCWNDER